MNVIRLLLTLALLHAGAAGAGTIPYKIEVLLFTNNDTEAFHSEKWPLKTEQPELEQAIPVFDGEPRSGFRALSDASMTLQQVKQLLENSDRFDVIKHIVWRQPGLSEKNALSVVVHGGKDFSTEYPERLQSRWEVAEDGSVVEVPGPERLDQLDGTIKVVLSRYLHVYTDLVLRKPVVFERLNEETQEVTRTPVLFDVSVREHRRMRSRELHYIDHPMLGMLVQITPL